MEFHKIDIIYAALPMHRKDNIFMQSRLVQNFTFILEWGQGTCSLTKQTRRWAYSLYCFLYAAYSALRHFFSLSQPFLIGVLGSKNLDLDNFEWKVNFHVD